MFGGLEMRAIGMLMTAHSGLALQRYLGSAQVRWLFDEGLVTEDGVLTEGGRRLAHHALMTAEFQLRPRTDAASEAHGGRQET